MCADAEYKPGDPIRIVRRVLKGRTVYIRTLDATVVQIKGDHIQYRMRNGHKRWVKYSPLTVVDVTGEGGA